MATSADNPQLDILAAATASTLQAAALRYAHYGLAVIPLNGKTPTIAGWQRAGIPGDRTIASWARTGKLKNVGLVCGINRLVVVDFDGWPAYEAFRERFPLEADTFTVATGSGRGAHVYLIVETPPDTIKAMRTPLGNVELKAGGQQVVAPPSIHPDTRRPYTVHHPADIRRVQDLAAIVDWIHALRGDTPPTSPGPPVRQPVTGSRAERYAAKAYNRLLDDLRRAGEGGRNDTLFKTGAQAFGMAAGGWPGLTADRIGADLRQIASAIGLGEREIDATLASARRAGAKQPRVLALPDRKSKHKPEPPARRRHAAGSGDGAQAVRYVSDDLTPAALAEHKTLLIVGPTGIGKTRAQADYVNSLPPSTRVTAMAQFRLLTQALHQVLPNSSHYEQSDAEHQRALAGVAQLVTSISSAARFNRQGDSVVMNDEVEGSLKFLATSSTFRANEAIVAWRSYKQTIATAGQFFGADANLSDIAAGVVERLRGPVTVKRYRPAAPRGKVSLLRSYYEAVAMIGRLLEQGRGQVYAPISSEKRSSDVADYFAERGWRVIKITRDTSNTAPVRAFCQDPAARRAYDLVVYDSAMGAGVDIPEPVFALVGIFDREPLAPEDGIQLVGRVRNASRRYAAVPPASEGYPTPTADELLADRLTRERWTARQLGVAPQDAGDYLELAQLWAAFEARAQHETARWRHHFTRRLQAGGYSVGENNARAPETFADAWKAWSDARAEQAWAFVRDAVGKALSDDRRDALRMAGVEITRDMHLANTRWHVENALGHDAVTERDRDLMKRRGLDGLYRLRDWLGGEDALIDDDRAQHDEGRPIHRRRYSTLARRTLAALFRLMSHDGTPEAQLAAFLSFFQTERPRADVEARYGALTSDRALALFRALGHRGNNALTVPGLCRWLLAYFGLKVNSRQVRTPDGRTMAYQLDADMLAYRLARARQAAALRLSKNVQVREKSTFLDTPAEPSPASPRPPLLPDVGAGAVLAALKAGRPVNPFARREPAHV
jgi:hypothetical protein